MCYWHGAGSHLSTLSDEDGEFGFVVGSCRNILLKEKHKLKINGKCMHYLQRECCFFSQEYQWTDTLFGSITPRSVLVSSYITLMCIKSVNKIIEKGFVNYHLSKCCSETNRKSTVFIRKVNTSCGPRTLITGCNWFFHTINLALDVVCVKSTITNSNKPQCLSVAV